MTGIYRSTAGRTLLQERYRAVLDAWPVPAEERTVATALGDTFVLVSGPLDGQPVVLLHGSGSTSASWRGDIETWAREFRVYAVDLVGEPGRSAPARPPLGEDTLARWLDEVLAGLGLDRAAFVGMSLGGWTALDYAVRRPERVTRLALLCPGGVGRQTPARILPALLLAKFGSRGVRRSAKVITGLDAPDVLADISLTFRHFRPRTETLPLRTDAELAALTMPVLVIVGAEDRMLDSADTAARMAACVPHAEVDVLPGIGHGILGQTERIRGFLARE